MSPSLNRYKKIELIYLIEDYEEKFENMRKQLIKKERDLMKLSKELLNYQENTNINLYGKEKTHKQKKIDYYNKRIRQYKYDEEKKKMYEDGIKRNYPKDN